MNEFIRKLLERLDEQKRIVCEYAHSSQHEPKETEVIDYENVIKIINEEAKTYMKKHLFGTGDYVFMTEQATSHKLQIGKIVEEYVSSNSAHYTVMFGDSKIEEIPMTEFENTAKLLIKRDEN